MRRRLAIGLVTGAAVQTPGDIALKTHFASLGAEPVNSTLENHAAFTRVEIAKWIEVARVAGIQPA